MAALPPETRAAIIEDLKSGKSQYRTAKDHGVGQGTVSKIAKAEGIAGIYSPPKSAIAAKPTYDLERRRQFSDQLFDQLKLDLDRGVPTKDVIMGFAILTDKRRLEEGEATERHEYTNTDRGAVTRRVDELATRRGTRSLVREPDRPPDEAVAV